MTNIITIAVSSVLLLFVLFLILQGKREYGTGYSALNKKEFPLKDMMYMGAYFGYNILKEKHLKISPNQVEKARQIYGQMSGRREVENKVRLFYIHKLTILGLLVGLASLIGLFTGIQGLTTPKSPEPQEITEIERPAFLEGNKEITYQVSAENKNPEDDTDKQSDIKVKVVIPRKDPTEQELKEALEIAKNNVETIALGKNPDWKNISTDMNFYEYDAKAGLILSWDLEDGSIFYIDGTIKNGLRTESAKIENVRVDFFYKEEKLGEWSKELTILPIQYTDAEQRERAVVEASTGINQKTQHVEQNKVQLPKEDSDKDVQMQWYEYIENFNDGKDNTALLYFLIFFFIAIVVYFGYDQELQRQVKERKADIEMEFPIFVDKFVLLLNCGNSVVASLNQSIQSAIASNEEKESHPLYQELLLLRQEIQQGVSDVEAFENFGRRVRIPSIMKFSSLIGQAIRKGDKEISNSLSGLVGEAWTKKKQLAKEKGAQASTKMLFPLAIMLLAIVAMIMAPAIFQMTG